MFDSIHEECGVFGIYENETTNVAASVYFGLYALQHRGQESCGITVCDDGIFRHKRADGLVSEVFTKDELDKLGCGNIAVGHVRYSTTGGHNHNNIQPLVIRHIKGNMALAHNGNLVNASELRRSFEMSGAIFHGTSDTEAIAYEIVRERLNATSTEEAVERAMPKLKGAYSCVLMTATKLIAFRDPDGFRPLCIGKTHDGAYIAASESCALETLGAEFIRDIEPGEIVAIGKDGLNSIRTNCRKEQNSCIFEYIYFARPDSVIDGVSVHHARLCAGKLLAQNSSVDADIVIGVPDSGLDAALGYANESGIPYGIGFIKNKYIGRSFIQPEQHQRENAVKIKLNAVRETVAGKRVIMIDDSIVRGTTSARIVRLLREAGAKEVHVRISSPPFLHSCYFGTDIDSEENLIAGKCNSTEEIAKYIGADSLAYLPVECLGELVGNKFGCCKGCFTGIYPVDTSGAGFKNKFDEKIHK
ncbi:amidophosphoribosyltransferase [Ruminococcus sp.]|uniref:amidophosphoribosyltransferase n=1 Tax=Ruminococcus sp. TaxID=41978 RepID=UPI001B5646C5|nr:amidophosphoribosyltransferase [Ruminococcus sp.]MBP5431175.1 amidophosphoribosyltransferase [Ruminococcus sp.]